MQKFSHPPLCGPLGVIGLSDRACQNKEMPISKHKVRGEENVSKECKNLVEKAKSGNLKGGE